MVATWKPTVHACETQIGSHSALTTEAREPRIARPSRCPRRQWQNADTEDQVPIADTSPMRPPLLIEQSIQTIAQTQTSSTLGAPALTTLPRRRSRASSEPNRWLTQLTGWFHKHAQQILGPLQLHLLRDAHIVIPFHTQERCNETRLTVIKCVDQGGESQNLMSFIAT